MGELLVTAIAQVPLAFHGRNADCSKQYHCYMVGPGDFLHAEDQGGFSRPASASFKDRAKPHSSTAGRPGPHTDLGHRGLLFALAQLPTDAVEKEARETSASSTGGKRNESAELC